MSCVVETLSGLRNIAVTVPATDAGYPLTEPSFLPGVPETEIDALVSVIGRALPTEYRTFLSHCGGIAAMDVWNGYALHPPDLIQRLLATGDVPLSLQGERLLPFGGDGGGNAFVLCLASGAVWKWRHDVFSEPFVFLTGSFLEFLERMAADWSRFTVGEGTWDYMAG